MAFLLFEILIIYLEILDFNIINKLSASFDTFDLRVNNIYKIKDPYEVIFKEIDFSSHIFDISFNIFGNFLLFYIGLNICKRILETREYLNNNGNLLPLSNNI